MNPTNRQSDQDQSKERQQQQTGRFQKQQGGRSVADDEANTEDSHAEKRSRRSIETDRHDFDNGDDVQGRSGRSVVHPDDEGGDDLDDETAETKFR